MKVAYRISFFLLLVAACAREPAESMKEVPVPQGGAAGSESLRDGDDDATGFGGGANTVGANVQIPHLTDTHPGYRQASCFDCHGATALYPHPKSTYRPPDCVACHGFNGAPHRDHAVVENPGCPSCHTTVVHVPKFKAPTDCIRCHYQK